MPYHCSLASELKKIQSDWENERNEKHSMAHDEWNVLKIYVHDSIDSQVAIQLKKRQMPIKFKLPHIFKFNVVLYNNSFKSY